MTSRFWALAGVLMTTLACALSLGGRVFYLLSLIAGLMLVYSAVSALMMRSMCRLTQRPDTPKVERGGEAHLLVALRSASPLPAAACELLLETPTGSLTAFVYPGWRNPRTVSFPISLPHVGVAQPRVVAVFARDVFGLFRLRRRIKGPAPEIIVLPRFFSVEKLHFARQDDGRALPNRASEDITSPEDVRAYREGDSMKRIHWKLSLRKRELLVRRFEVPAPPDTLILMDCSNPVGAGQVEDGEMKLRDTLCETALSVAHAQMADGHSVRVPLYGAQTSEFHASDLTQLDILREELACQLFRGGEPFDRVLNVELRRMRRTGATIVITTRLTPQIVEGVKHIRRSGPNVRFYLVTFNAEDAAYAPLIQQMQHQLVEVMYVTPA